MGSSVGQLNGKGETAGTSGSPARAIILPPRITTPKAHGTHPCRGYPLAALGVFAGAPILQAAAMIVNPFFSPALRIQAEHGHSVITRRPYRFLRHPGYLAMLIAVPASALALGPWLALIPAFSFSKMIIRRTALVFWAP